MRTNFWRNENSWPRDGGQFIFLARAANLLGKYIFSGEWTGAEFTTDLHQSLPATPPFGASGRAYFAHNLLIARRPDFNRTPLALAPRGSAAFTTMPLVVTFSADEWAAALEIVKQDNEQARPALMRAAQVQRRLTDLAASGELRTALRAKAGGSFHEIPAEWWNTEQISNRFDLCQMNPKEPFGIGSAGDHYCWIFVEQEGLLKQRTSLEKGPDTVTAPPEQTLNRSAADKRRIFAEWRTSRGDDIPTISEDVTAMKERGINREDTRELRKDFPARPGGAPKKHSRK